MKNNLLLEINRMRDLMSLNEISAQLLKGPMLTFARNNIKKAVRNAIESIPVSQLRTTKGLDPNKFLSQNLAQIKKDIATEANRLGKALPPAADLDAQIRSEILRIAREENEAMLKNLKGDGLFKKVKAKAKDPKVKKVGDSIRPMLPKNPIEAWKWLKNHVKQNKGKYAMLGITALVLYFYFYPDAAAPEDALEENTREVNEAWTVFPCVTSNPNKKQFNMGDGTIAYIIDGINYYSDGYYVQPGNNQNNFKSVRGKYECVDGQIKFVASGPEGGGGSGGGNQGVRRRPLEAGAFGTPGDPYQYKVVNCEWYHKYGPANKFFADWTKTSVNAAKILDTRHPEARQNCPNRSGERTTDFDRNTQEFINTYKDKFKQTNVTPNTQNTTPPEFNKRMAQLATENPGKSQEELKKINNRDIYNKSVREPYLSGILGNDEKVY
jgi:hypothetical protein